MINNILINITCAVIDKYHLCSLAAIRSIYKQFYDCKYNGVLSNFQTFGQSILHDIRN